MKITTLLENGNHDNEERIKFTVNKAIKMENRNHQWNTRNRNVNRECES